jgi:hypothetical protein
MVRKRIQINKIILIMAIRENKKSRLAMQRIRVMIVRRTLMIKMKKV